jgi:F-type H+-transporting ATPase subunit b
MDKMKITWTLVVQFLMFLSAMFILTRFLFKPMLAVFAKRARLTEQPHEDAAVLRKDAAGAKQAVEETFNQTRKEVERLRGELLGVVSRQEREILAEARASAGQTAEQARQELTAAVTQSRTKLVAEADELAELLANKLLEIQR